MRIHNAEFGMKEIVISVGFFKTRGIEDLFAHCKPKYVEAYDPNMGVFQSYANIYHKYKGKFVPIPKAIAGISKTAVLKGKSYNSTIESRPDVVLATQQQVHVIPFTDVIRQVHDAFGVIHRVVLNCEGSEIPIIQATDPSVFLLCQYLFIQFHTFNELLSVDRDTVLKCIKKLDITHNMKLVTKSRMEYEGYLK